MSSKSERGLFLSRMSQHSSFVGVVTRGVAGMQLKPSRFSISQVPMLMNLKVVNVYVWENVRTWGKKKLKRLDDSHQLFPMTIGFSNVWICAAHRLGTMAKGLQQQQQLSCQVESELCHCYLFGLSINQEEGWRKRGLVKAKSSGPKLCCCSCCVH